MSEPWSGIESELGQFMPAALPAEVRMRVGVELGGGGNRGAGRASPGYGLSDRLLMGAMGLGLAAAVMIGGMVGMDWVGGKRSGEAVPNAVMTQVWTRSYLAQLVASKDMQVAPAQPLTTAPN